jgi:hypothetical protein
MGEGWRVVMGEGSLFTPLIQNILFIIKKNIFLFGIYKILYITLHHPSPFTFI